MTYSFSPSVDSIAEFKVETSTYSADAGGAPGGQVNMLTKRGGNVFHGTLWEFNRSNALTQTGDKRTWLRWFNTDAFAIPPFGRLGNAPRTNAIRLPGLVNFAFSVNKAFPISERLRPEFRTEVFNLFNHFNPDPSTVDRNIRSATFGSIGGGVRGVTTRVIQLGLKLNF